MVLQYINIFFTDALVAMVISSDTVAEGVGNIMVCVDSGITGNVETVLIATLTASEGKASEC